MQDELALYKESLMMLTSFMDECNWDCVKNCSDIAIDIKSKAKCFDICACYEEKGEDKKQEKESMIPFDF